MKINQYLSSKFDFKNGKEDVLAIKFEDILDITNNDDEIIILGDKDDKVILHGGIKSENNEDGKWESSGTKNDEEGNTYNIYQSSNGSNIVKLLIEDDIDINTI